MSAASHSRKRVGPNLYLRGDGVYVAGLTIGGKWKMKRLTARTKREATQQLAKLRVEAGSAATAKPAAITFSDLAMQFIARFDELVRVGERSVRTADHYRWALHDYLLPAWENTPVAGLAPDDVVTLTASLRSAGATPSVLNAVEETASVVFSFAVRRGAIDSNPVAKLERGERSKRKKNSDRRVLTHVEITRLLAASDLLPVRAMLAVMLYTGVRQGELLGLRWMDIDFTGGFVRLRKQLQRPAEDRPATLAPLKMDSERDVVLVPQLASLLRKHKLATPHSQDADFVFASEDGSFLHYSRMNRLINKVASAANVERPNAHVFRRTYASHLIIELRLDVVRVQRQLGHSRPSVTYDRYSYLFEQARHADELRTDIAESTYGGLLV